jgi:hypothetical protein
MSIRDLLIRKDNGFVVGGVHFAKPPTNEDETTQLILEVATQLVTKLPTEQDLYWFVIEQYDKMISYGSEVTSLVDFPLSLYEIEYEGRKSEKSYVGKRNPGMVFLDTEYMPVLSEHFGQKRAEHWRCLIFALLCSRHKAAIDGLRMKYAVHYHNDCVSRSSWSFADKWNKVISSLGGD